MTTFLTNFLIPLQLCLATNGAYAPVNLYPEATAVCFAMLGRQFPTSQLISPVWE